MIYLNHKKLNNLFIKILMSEGIDKNSSYTLSSSIIRSSLRGIDSHGIRLFPHYLNVVKKGRINKKPKFKINYSKNSLTLDADGCFGQHASIYALNLALKKIKNNSIYAVSIKNSSHFGAAAYYSDFACMNKYISFSFTNADPLINIPGTNKVFTGTNPFCVSIPTQKGEYFNLDMATSNVAWNKIKIYENVKKLIPHGWGIDRNGKSTDKPEDTVSLSPFGGYKGLGISMVIEILCSVLSGSTLGFKIPPMASNLDKKRDISHFFLLINVNNFINLSKFKKSMKTFKEEFDKSKLNSKEIFFPGEKEIKNYHKNLTIGIKCDKDLLESLLLISDKFKDCVK